MLVLSRKRNERIIIYDRTNSTKLGSFFIKAIRGADVKIVFDVNESIGISRSEVYEEELTKKRKRA